MKRLNTAYLLIILTCLVSCSEKPAAGKQVLITEGFSKQVLDGYWLYLPKNYEENKKWPMIMFLEGGDASASPNPNTVQNGGPVRYMLKQRKDLPDSFVIVNPHMKTGTRAQRQWFKNADALIQIIDQTIKEYNIDPGKIYLTGRSRGGHGTWGVAKRYPEKFAAIVPIAGAITCKSGCDKLADLPLWIIHNNGDPVVDYEYPREVVSFMENELNSSFAKTSDLDNDDIKNSTSIFTTFDSDQHGGAGAKVYASRRLYDWLLSQTRDVK